MAPWHYFFPDYCGRSILSLPTCIILFIHWSLLAMLIKIIVTFLPFKFSKTTVFYCIVFVFCFFLLEHYILKCQSINVTATTYNTEFALTCLAVCLPPFTRHEWKIGLLHTGCFEKHTVTRCSAENWSHRYQWFLKVPCSLLLVQKLYMLWSLATFSIIPFLSYFDHFQRLS